MDKPRRVSSKKDTIGFVAEARLEQSERLSGKWGNEDNKDHHQS